MKNDVSPVGIPIRVSQSATGYRYLRGRVAPRSKWRNERRRTETPSGGTGGPRRGHRFLLLSARERALIAAPFSLRSSATSYILSLSRWHCSKEERERGPWAERRLNGFNEPLRSSNRENQSWIGPKYHGYVYICILHSWRILVLSF